MIFWKVNWSKKEKTFHNFPNEIGFDFFGNFSSNTLLISLFSKTFYCENKFGIQQKINESDNLRATPTQSFPNCLFGIEIETFPLGIPINLWGKQNQVSSFVNLPPRFKAQKNKLRHKSTAKENCNKYANWQKHNKKFSVFRWGMKNLMGFAGLGVFFG
jgi:hypothetical protein